MRHRTWFHMVRTRKLFGTVLNYCVAFYCGTHCITEYIIDFTWCTGPSMVPTVQNNDILLTEHFTTKFQHRVYKGDVVVFRSPSSPHHYLCKRVIATEFDEMHVPSLWKFVRTSKTVPEGHIWVEGDCRHNSTDSRDFGPVPLGLVRGRAICRVWPFSSMGPLPER